MQLPVLARRLARHRAALLAIAVALGACAGPPQPAPDARAGLFSDERFAPPAEVIDTERIFALNDAMREFIRNNLNRDVHGRSSVEALVDALYNEGKLKLVYDAAHTRNAAEAFDDRAGNCVSLAIMTAAFAKALGLQVSYQSADMEELWGRGGGLLVGSGHVNVTISDVPDAVWRPAYAGPVTVDFLPQDEVGGLRTREIPERMVVSMYLNNRAAEALVGARLDDAYAWARAALRASPDFASAWNTLGVIYRRHGDEALAQGALREALALQPDNTLALSNLSELLERQGDLAAARQLRQRLERREGVPPFYYFNLGLAAMRKEDYLTARAQFAREVARADYSSEFHFWLGLADYRLGKLDLAREELALAQERSTTRGERELYGAKLAWLRLHGAGVDPGGFERSVH